MAFIIQIKESNGVFGAMQTSRGEVYKFDSYSKALEEAQKWYPLSINGEGFIITTEDGKTRFRFNIICDTEPMVSDPFYMWLDTTENKNSRFIDNVKEYLSGFGYNKDLHFISDRDLEILRYVHEIFWRQWIPVKTVFSFSELFVPASHGFSVTDETEKYKPLGLFKLTDKLKELIGLHNRLIYDYDPNKFTFQIIGDRLYLHYSTIIGSFPVCNIMTD